MNHQLPRLRLNQWVGLQVSKWDQCRTKVLNPRKPKVKRQWRMQVKQISWSKNGFQMSQIITLWRIEALSSNCWASMVTYLQETSLNIKWKTMPIRWSSSASIRSRRLMTSSKEGGKWIREPNICQKTSLLKLVSSWKEKRYLLPLMNEFWWQDWTNKSIVCKKLKREKKIKTCIQPRCRNDLGSRE